MVDRVCRCGKTFVARAADIKRGWGKFCSKSCKAIKQEQTTGQYAKFKDSLNSRRDNDGCFQMSAAELACGGYGDADNNSPFGDGKY